MSNKKAYKKGYEAGRADVLQAQQEERTQRREKVCALLWETVVVMVGACIPLLFP